METAIPLLLFLGLLMGGGVLVLACGIKSREEEREAQRSDPRTAHDLLADARFFAVAHASALADPIAIVVERTALARVEAYLHGELALVELHMAEAGAETTREHASADESRESLLQRLERFLDREQTLVAEFVSDPSVARLYQSADLVPVAA